MVETTRVPRRGKLGIPTSTPLVDPNGFVTEAWRLFFTSLTSAAGAAVDLPPDGSPYAFTAPGIGTVVVQGGTVSSVTITRGRSVVATGVTAGMFPMAQGDTITVTYSGAPTITYLPD